MKELLLILLERQWIFEQTCTRMTMCYPIKNTTKTKAYPPLVIMISLLSIWMILVNSEIIVSGRENKTLPIKFIRERSLFYLTNLNLCGKNKISCHMSCKMILEQRPVIFHAHWSLEMTDHGTEEMGP